MKVSVCVPIYGVEKYIRRCAESLFRQTMHSDIEYIFVNDCTKDKSMEVLAQVIDEFPWLHKQIKIVHHEKNKGLAGARNTALKHAEGDYIIHCDSDDMVDKCYCENMYNAAVENNADVSACPIFLWQGDSTAGILSLPEGGLESWFTQSFHSAVFNSLCNKMFARHIALDPSIQVPDNITMAEDLLRTTQMLLKCKKAVTGGKLGSYYHYYLGHSGASTTHYSARTFASEREVVRILDKLLPEKYANQRNACWGLLLLAGLCSEGVSIEDLQQTVSREQHRLALNNHCISFAKRQLLKMAYYSMPMARSCAMAMLRLRNKLRTL